MKPFASCLTVALVAASLAAPAVVSAADYPSRPITVMVPFPAGGSTDSMARAAARELEGILGTNIPVNNVSGGAGTVGTAQLARARPDGYTIGVIPAAPLINQPHMRKTPYTIDDFEYVCQLFYSPQALAVKPDSPFSSLTDVIDHARKHPNELTYGSPGPGSLPHLAMEKFLVETGAKIKHVPFQGDGPGVTALLGGHVDLYMAIISNVAKNNLNAVGLFAEERLESAPDLSTSIEQGFKTTASWWGGLFTPKGTPEGVRAKLEDACKQTAKNERFRQTLHKLGSFVLFRDSAGVRKAVEEGSATNKEIIARVLK